MIVHGRGQADSKAKQKIPNECENVKHSAVFRSQQTTWRKGTVLPRNARNNWNNESVSLIESLQFDSEPAREGKHTRLAEIRG